MKKIILSAAAIVLVGGTLVFANTASKNDGNTCPDGKVCICTPDGKCIILKDNSSTDCSSICPDRPGCICSE